MLKHYKSLQHCLPPPKPSCNDIIDRICCDFFRQIKEYPQGFNVSRCVGGHVLFFFALPVDIYFDRYYV